MGGVWSEGFTPPFYLKWCLWCIMGDIFVRVMMPQRWISFAGQAETEISGELTTLLLSCLPPSQTRSPKNDSGYSAPRHGYIEPSPPRTLGVRGVLPPEKCWNFVRKIMHFCAYLDTAPEKWVPIVVHYTQLHRHNFLQVRVGCARSEMCHLWWRGSTPFASSPLATGLHIHTDQTGIILCRWV